MSTEDERSGFDGGYTQLPRWVARELEDRHLNLTEFSILAYLCAAGADRFGVPTTYNDLARKLGVSASTVRRYLPKLREKGLIKYELAQGQVEPFRVTTGPRLSDQVSDALSDALSDVAPAFDDAVSDVVTEFNSASGEVLPPDSVFRSGDQLSDVLETELDLETEKRCSGSFEASFVTAPAGDEQQSSGEDEEEQTPKPGDDGYERWAYRASLEGRIVYDEELEDLLAEHHRIRAEREAAEVVPQANNEEQLVSVGEDDSEGQPPISLVAGRDFTPYLIDKHGRCTRHPDDPKSWCLECKAIAVGAA